MNFIPNKICICSLKNIRLVQIIKNPSAFYFGRVTYKISQDRRSSQLICLWGGRQSWVIRRLNYTCGSCSTFPSSTPLIGNEHGAGLISADPYLLPIGPMPHNTSCTQRVDEFLISREFVPVDLRPVHTIVAPYVSLT